MAFNYQHQPLASHRSIRLFTLFASRDRKAATQGSLVEVNLDSNPPFEALSYVWGGPDPISTVTVITQCANGNRTKSTLQVTPNCLSALQTLRYRSKPRMLWIDAICIDQTSTAEKNQQVPLMAEIYGKARQVLVWLNPGNQDQKRVLETGRLFGYVGWLHRMRLLRLYEKDEETDSRMPKETRLVTACEKWVDSKCQKLGDSFNAAFMNAYFQRVWTVQEIAMAHNIRVHYGAANASWPDFVASGLFAVKRGGFAKNQEAEIDVFRDLDTHWNLLNALESHFVLPDIYGVEALYDRHKKGNILRKYTDGTANLALIKSRGLNATEAKDKAYSMLWAFPESSNGIDPLRCVDYNKPIDVIFTEYTTAIFIKTKGSPTQFYMINSTSRNPNLPSWVPDWEKRTSMSYFLWTSQLMNFQAANEYSRENNLEVDGRILRISGVEQSKMKALIRLSEEARQRNVTEGGPEELMEGLIDTAEVIRGVIHVSRTIIGCENKESLESFHRVIHSQKHLHNLGPEDQIEFDGKLSEVEVSRRLNISIGLLRLRVFDKLSFLMDESTFPKDLVRTVLEEFLPKGEIDKITYDTEQLPNLAPFFAIIAALSPYIDIYRFLYVALLDHRDKDFFITDKGNIGVAFQGLKNNEVVAIWRGCPSPVIVRGVEVNGKDMYLLHGPAYVDGIMNGESWVENEDDLRVFELT
ncbi:heterokaryon incompatibility protein-domain-containing protein [Tricladium varicosporioides]|nr:heterokaryon incompatibility protein-domain-containing protein [Hymenoscyphus varicosporioides]